jgi:DNA-binding SARP family transcriptional activator
LGTFSILKDDRRVDFGRKAPTRLLLLLKAIVAFGGRDVPVARLLDAVWPDLEGHSATESLHVSVHRLRKLVGDDALVIRDGRVSLNAKSVWTDLWEFERLLVDAAVAERAGHAEQSMLMARRALAIYGGDFLGHDMDMPWAQAAREKWRGRYMQQVRQLGTRLADAGTTDDALAVYLRALEIDDCAEPVYQDAMRCCIRTGRHSEGLLLYRRLHASLSASLGVAPSPASDSLRQELVVG